MNLSVSCKIHTRNKIKKGVGGGRGLWEILVPNSVIIAKGKERINGRVQFFCSFVSFSFLDKKKINTKKNEGREVGR